MLLASVSMVSAGTVEYFRLQTNSTTVNHVFGNKTIEARNMTIWYQIPQYGLMGMSEIFVLITGTGSIRIVSMLQSLIHFAVVV